MVNPVQARQLLAAVTYVGGRRRQDRDRGRRLHAFFACLCYAGLRPGEAHQLRRADCMLPVEGWGELLLTGSRTEVSAGYFAPRGARHHERPLKRRSPEAVRPVPIPPVLVAILREHMDVHGTSRDGRLFFGVETGENVPGSVYTRIWEQAREIGLGPQQAASQLARRPYDLRHAALSIWLAAGVRLPPRWRSARGTPSRCC